MIKYMAMLNWGECSHIYQGSKGTSKPCLTLPEERMVCGVLVYLAVLVGHLPLALGLRFHSLFMPGMVLQRDVPTTLWGFDLEGSLDTELSCSTASGTKSYHKLATISTTTREGVWEVEVPPQEAGTVCTLQANTATESLVLTDVLFGDVWLCSGQSNMELTMTNIINSTEEIAASAAFTTIRYMVVGHAVSEAADPDADVAVEQGWADPMDAARLANMSAVCFLYARSLQALWAAEGREVVPLGLVAASWGGTPVEAWTPPDTLATCGVEEVPGCTPDYPHHCPAHLYNGMVLPLTRAALTGFLWYQGEANRVNNRDDYACTFPGMIEAWREAFSSTSATPADAAFGFVQLASWRPDSLEAGFPVIRWHQVRWGASSDQWAQTADVGYVPNPRMERVFMAVALDTFDEKEGYPGNIHTRWLRPSHHIAAPGTSRWWPSAWP